MSSWVRFQVCKTKGSSDSFHNVSILSTTEYLKMVKMVSLIMFFSLITIIIIF